MTGTEVTGAAQVISEVPQKFKKMESKCTSAPGTNVVLVWTLLRIKVIWGLYICAAIFITNKPVSSLSHFYRTLEIKFVINFHEFTALMIK